MPKMPVDEVPADPAIYDRPLMLEFNIISGLPDSDEIQWEWYNGLNQEERQIVDAAFDRFIKGISSIVLRRIREVPE